MLASRRTSWRLSVRQYDATERRLALSALYFRSVTRPCSSPKVLLIAALHKTALLFLQWLVERRFVLENVANSTQKACPLSLRPHAGEQASECRSR